MHYFELYNHWSGIIVKNEVSFVASKWKMIVEILISYHAIVVILGVID